MQNGYIGVYQPDHPRAGPTGYVFEHPLVVERAIGKHISVKHHVHHIDLNESNNANDNLVACEDAAYHKLLHKRQRALDACGNANARFCVRCKGHDNQEGMKVYGKDAVHSACATAHTQKCKARRLAKAKVEEETSATVGA